MPWKCSICGSIPTQQLPQGLPGSGPSCYKTPQCKKKGKYACKWTVAVVQQVQQTPNQQSAAGLGYTVRVNTSTANFPNGHRTNVVFANPSRNRAISPDGSTHSGSRAGWKGFTSRQQGWTYCGSFQMDLKPWSHRPNVTFKGNFPKG